MNWHRVALAAALIFVAAVIVSPGGVDGFTRPAVTTTTN